MAGMATWALKQHQRNPQAHIVCVVSNLQQQKSEIIRHFNEQSKFEGETHWEYDLNPIVNIGGGRFIS